MCFESQDVIGYMQFEDIVVAQHIFRAAVGGRSQKEPPVSDA